ncbi:CaiB/BaiF CoA transferase family protein [Chloroflexota bacterium]
MNQGNKNTPLSGYRILDLADEKGMLCSRLLGDMGAEVVRVEKPRIAAARDSFFWANNSGKRAITLNLEVKAGQELFKRLARTADILVESFAPGHLEGLGLGYLRLSQINPRLIMAAITGFGQSGPYRDYKSSDLVASALGGAMYVSGEPQSPPLRAYGCQAYLAASLFAVNGILLALWSRHSTGKGQYIDISLQECVAATLDHVLVRYFYEGVTAEKQGSQHWNNAFRIFPCRDGYILLSLFQQWETLVEWLKAEGMARDLTDRKWLNPEERLRGLEHIIEVMEGWTRSHRVAELVEQGQALRFPWAEVSSIPQLVENPQLRERSFWTEIEPPEGEIRYKSPGAPVQLSRSPWQTGGKVPRPGEHNREIYHHELELSAEEMAALTKDGII